MKLKQSLLIRSMIDNEILMNKYFLLKLNTKKSVFLDNPCLADYTMKENKKINFYINQINNICVSIMLNK